MPTESNLAWLLLGLPIAFALGWLASRMDWRQVRLDNREAPKAYFKGLNYLLNEQQDQAIDAFIEAVQKDPDTSELHFALGNLFRRRGEYERAVRVHEHLLSRADLSAAERDRAQHALALDFLKAGLLDRAEQALLKLEGTAFEAEARLALLSNYERCRDWIQADAVAEKIERAGQGRFTHRRAHYACEQSALAMKRQEPQAALSALEQAIDLAPDAPRPRLDLAQLYTQQGELDLAQHTLLKALDHAPSGTPLVALALADLARRHGDAEAIRFRLEAVYTECAALDVLMAIVSLLPQDARNSAGRDWLARHLEREPSLVAAAHWMAGETLCDQRIHPLVQRALDHAVRPLLRYRCAACGFEATRHFWQCPGCQTWDSYPTRRIEEL